MKQYNVTGMSCAACSARVEKAVAKVPGVESVAVSLLTNSMGVEGTADSRAVIKAVEAAGYGASSKSSSKKEVYKGTSSKEAVSENTFSTEESSTEALSWEDDAVLKDTETPKMLRRLAYSLVFLAALMYVSMGHMMWGLPVPEVFDNLVFTAVFEMLLAIIVMIINAKFFTSGFKALFHFSPNMDTLVALGSSASFAYSLAELFIMILAQGSGDHETVIRYGMNLYFESAAMIPALITVGKMLEALSKGRTTDALKGLMKLAPKKAILLKNGEEKEVGINEVRVGDVFVVKPGESIPVDGKIIEGITAINEASLTGESIPSDKEKGDSVFAATINLSGYIKCTAQRVGEDTTLARIIKTVSDAAATKAPIARIADKVSAVFVPLVMGIAAFTFIGWVMTGESPGFAVARAITVLVISCPCALGLATPVAIMVGSGMGAKNGILYKTAASLEGVGRTEIIALDKTGTITEGEPRVTDIEANGISNNELLSYAAALESKSEHPLAGAVMEKIKTDNISGIPEVTDFTAMPGNGLKAKCTFEGKEEPLYGGSLKYISSFISVEKGLEEKANTFSNEGKTPLLFALSDKLLGIIAVADTIKEDSGEAIKELKNMGLKVVMLTGDNERTANAIGKKAGVDEVIAGVLPEGKSDIIKGLQKSGKVAMVGDGINDAPALTVADVGIAIGAGTDIAIDAADIVVMKSRLTDVSAAIRLSRAAIHNIHENLFWAFIYNAVCIPLAMGLYGLQMKPMYGAAAMALSSFFVCMNALRLNLVKIHDAKRDKKIRKKSLKDDFSNTHTLKEKIMKKTINIEGMMCGHCEASVKKALEALPGVESAAVSHKEGTAVVELSSEVSDEVLKKAVEDKDYTVKGIA